MIKCFASSTSRARQLRNRAADRSQFRADSKKRDRISNNMTRCYRHERRYLTLGHLFWVLQINMGSAEHVGQCHDYLRVRKTPIPWLFLSQFGLICRCRTWFRDFSQSDASLKRCVKMENKRFSTNQCTLLRTSSRIFPYYRTVFRISGLRRVGKNMNLCLQRHISPE